MALLVRATLILPFFGLSLAHAEPAARFEPPSPVDKAQAHYVRGKQFFDAKQYSVAAAEFAAAYELDPQSKFLLFNLGVARRMAGACKESIEAYRAFLEAAPPHLAATNARVGIERCEKVIASLPPSPEPPEDKPVHPDVVPSEPMPVTPVTPVPDGPVEPAATRVASTASPEPWYRDRMGDALVGAGAVSVLASAVPYGVARHDADATGKPGSLGDYESNRSAATALQTASWITAGVGAALVVSGIVHYATRPTRHSLAVAPLHGGVHLVLEGRF